MWCESAISFTTGFNHVGFILCKVTLRKRRRRS